MVCWGLFVACNTTGKIMEENQHDICSSCDNRDSCDYYSLRCAHCNCRKLREIHVSLKIGNKKSSCFSLVHTMFLGRNSSFNSSAGSNGSEQHSRVSSKNSVLPSLPPVGNNFNLNANPVDQLFLSRLEANADALQGAFEQQQKQVQDKMSHV